MTLPDTQLRGLIQEAKIIDEQLLSESEEYAKVHAVSLYRALVDRKIIAEERLGSLVATSSNIPIADLSNVTIPEDIFHIIPERITRKYKVLAYARENGAVKIAASDPYNVEILEMLAKKTNSQILVSYASERDIENTHNIYRKSLQQTVDELLRGDTTSTAKLIDEDIPIIKIVDLLINSAYHDKASDIHIEPVEAYCLVRFRIDGVLHDVLKISKLIHDRIITRIKVMSNLRTDEHLSAQDGKMRVILEEETIDIRVSLVPIADGEKAVLRLLTSKSRAYNLSDLGMNMEDLKKVKIAYSRSYGMILSTGPTGAGKTTSIYAILLSLNSRETNITTIEDPVEYRITGANQIQVNVKTNLTFANGLRSILRQDPNIVFVGEIRDSETAGIAVNAAMTGHLVLSTLHTNNAATAIPRLSDMKVEPFLVASSVNLIIAQRLIRRICDSCRAPYKISRVDMEKKFGTADVQKHFGLSETVELYNGTGCKVCHRTGYSGRIGLYEVLEVSEKIRKLIVQKSDADLINAEAIAEGMTTMLDDGLQKIKKGLTTVEEVVRVTKIEI